MRLTDYRVLVTGASRGIGRAIAIAFAREGCHLALAARSEKELAGVAGAARALGVNALPIKTDLTSPQDIEKLVADARAGLERIDILVNNAGVAVMSPVLETRLEDWETMLNVNLRAAFLLCKAVVPEMVEREDGIVFNIASVAGLQPFVGQGGYCASKHGLVGFSRVLALEMRPYDVRVHTICPGGVATQLITGIRPDIAVADLMRPEDIAEFVIYLAKLPDTMTIEEVHVKRFGEEFRKRKR